MSSRNMCLLPRATLHSDSEQECCVCTEEFTHCWLSKKDSFRQFLNINYQIILRLYCSVLILFKHSYKILYIYLVENLTLDHHKQHFVSKLTVIYLYIYCMNRVKNFFPKLGLRSLYFANFHHPLTY